MKLKERAVLDKSLNQAGVLTLAIGSIIGWGCFILPGDMLRDAGPLGAAIGICLGAIAMLIIGKSFSYMVERLPVSGGEFAYAYKGFGRYHAYVCGWFLTLGYLSIIALNATALSILGKFVAPGLFTVGYLYSVAGSKVYTGEVILASGAILIFGYLSYIGSKKVGSIQVYMVAILTAAVLLIAGGAGVAETSLLSNLTPVFSPEHTPLAGILAIVAIGPWLFVGFDTIPQAAEEYNFPAEKAGGLIMGSIIIGALLYILVLIATALVFPWQEVVNAVPGHNWDTGYVMQAAIGKLGLVFLVVAISMGICTGINGFFMATSRLIFSMGRARVLPKWFLHVDPKSNVPQNAVLFTGAIALIAPWFGRNVIEWVVAMSSLGIAFGYAYTCFGAYKECRKDDGDQVKSPIKGYTAFIGGIISLAMLLLLLVPGSPGFMGKESLYASLVWIGIGVLFYFFQAKNYSQLPKEELDHLILNKRPDE